MPKSNSRDRVSTEINAGSMADIAFLLLIFFLVTTQIVEDKGILVKLPPWSEEEPETTKLKTRNVFSVLVNAQNQLLVRGEPLSLDQLRQTTKDFIRNPTRREDYAESPNKAIVSLKNDRGTNYETYLGVYNEIKGAYNELRDKESQRKYGKDFDELDKARMKEIIDIIPLLLSEAEPTSFGEEN